MAIIQQVGDEFDQVIPGAGEFSEQFLGVVKQRCEAEQIGLTLAPVKPRRKDPRIVLRADIVLGRMMKKATYHFEVFADPRGSSLHVGWQTTSDQIGGMLSGTNMASYTNARTAARQRDPGIARELSGLLQAFQATVFLPTMQQLADAAARKQGISTDSGFFGA